MSFTAAWMLTLALAASSPADPTITGLRAHLDSTRVLADFRLVGAFDKDLTERIESGLATNLTYEFELLKDRKRWFDRPLKETTLQVSALYDAVAREYLINTKLDGKLIDSRSIPNLVELEQAMTRFRDVPLFTLGQQPGRRRLLIKVRAILGTEAWLGLLPMKRTTNWVESRKFWPPEELVP